MKVRNQLNSTTVSLKSQALLFLLIFSFYLPLHAQQKPPQQQILVIDPQDFAQTIAAISKKEGLDRRTQERFKAFHDEVVVSQKCDKPASNLTAAKENFIRRALNWYVNHPASRLADRMDNGIDYAVKFYEGEVQDSLFWVAKSAVVNTVGDLSKGFVDLLRVGQGSGDAIGVLNSRDATVGKKIGAAAAGFGMDTIRSLFVADIVSGGSISSAAKVALVKKFPVLGTQITLFSPSAQALGRTAESSGAAAVASKAPEIVATRARVTELKNTVHEVLKLIEWSSPDSAEFKQALELVRSKGISSGMRVGRKYDKSLVGTAEEVQKLEWFLGQFLKMGTKGGDSLVGMNSWINCGHAWWNIPDVPRPQALVAKQAAEAATYRSALEQAITDGTVKPIQLQTSEGTTRVVKVGDTVTLVMNENCKGPFVRAGEALNGKVTSVNLGLTSNSYTVDGLSIPESNIDSSASAILESGTAN